MGWLPYSFAVRRAIIMLHSKKFVLWFICTGAL